MTNQPGKSLFSFPLDLIKAFMYTFRVFSAFMKEARQITFSDSEEETIDEQIKIKARKLLQTQVENYGSKVITPHVEDQVKAHLNNCFVNFAQEPDNQSVHQKIESLMQHYLKQFDLKRITRDSQDQVESFFNRQLTERICAESGRLHHEVDQKIEYLLLELLESTGQNKIFGDTKARIDNFLNERLLERACQPATEPTGGVSKAKHPKVDQKIETLLLELLETTNQQKISEETRTQIDDFLNDRLLERACVPTQPDPASGAVKPQHPEVDEKIETLLLELLEATNQQKINQDTRSQIDQFLNARILEKACSSGNAEMTDKIKELTGNYIKSLTQVALTEGTFAEIRQMINERGLAWTRGEGLKELQAKAQELFSEMILDMDTRAIAQHAIDALKEVLSQLVEEIGTTAGNLEARQKAEELSAVTINRMKESDIDERTVANVVIHVNQELLKFACDHSNEIILVRLTGILQELVNGMGAHSLYPETENAIKLNLNTRAVELAQIPDNEEMIQSAETLLKLYLKESNKAEVVDQESMASIKKALNEVIVTLMQQTGKIEQEARRVFNEILENCGPNNIDPLVRMKIESVLYKLLVKQLAVYGNKELTNKALELIREVAQNLPHDSSTNDLIMGHKVRQPDPA
ncbi:MAG: hypothetical protein RRB13_14970 [bacterium]|nr:hypothetical protein [bacterium]